MQINSYLYSLSPYHKASNEMFFCSLVAILSLFTCSYASEDLCQFPKYKDSKSIEASKQKLNPLVGKTFTVQDTKTKFQYTVGICTKVANNIKNPDLAVFQQGLNDDGSVNDADGHDIGALKDTHVMTGTDWILLEYRSEEAYSSHCGSEKKHSFIMITCDKTASDDDPKLLFIEEENQKQDSCYYLFELKHKAVCPIASSSGLSVGSIILIIAIVVASLYLIVGVLYKRFMLGAKGMEQIPNYEFWKDFGNLQADGCDLICRSRERRRAGGFGGIGDDQLDQPEEIQRDDNLLPM